jgi:hypothetical protein
LPKIVKVVVNPINQFISQEDLKRMYTYTNSPKGKDTTLMPTSNLQDQKHFQTFDNTQKLETFGSTYKEKSIEAAKTLETKNSLRISTLSS